MRRWLPSFFLLGCAAARTPDPVPPTAPTASPPAEVTWLADPELWPAVREGLAGEWLSNDGNWRLEAHAVARGSALVQTWHSAGGETLNLFHPDGDALVMTHVCAQGNQATLRARSAEGGRVVFEQIGVTNFAPGSGSLCRLEIAITDDALHLVEQYCDGAGTPGTPTAIALHRAGPQHPPR